MIHIFKVKIVTSVVGTVWNITLPGLAGYIFSLFSIAAFSLTESREVFNLSVCEHISCALIENLWSISEPLHTPSVLLLPLSLSLSLDSPMTYEFVVV